MTPDGRLG